MDAVPLPFIRGEHLPAYKADPYFGPYTSPNIILLEATPLIKSGPNATAKIEDIIIPNLNKNPGLIFYINLIIGFQHLYIPSDLVREILIIIYSNKYPRFQRCYKIIASS